MLVEPAGAGRLDSIIVDVSESIDLAPSSIVLSALEQKLASERHDARTGSAAALDALPPLYDFVLIDCLPNVGLLTFNALRAAREVIIPLETSFFAIDGVQKLLETISLLSDRIGHRLHVRVLPTLYDGRTRYARNTSARFASSSRSSASIPSYARTCVKPGRPRRPVSRSLATRRRPSAPSITPRSRWRSWRRRPRSSLPIGPERRGATAESTVPREVVVRFKDATAGDVRIAGDFNGWVPDRGVRSPIASEGQTRVWTKVPTLEPGTYQYATSSTESGARIRRIPNRHRARRGNRIPSSTSVSERILDR